MGQEELIKMLDNDGTPLAKKAETISYSDIYSTKEDTPRVSLNKAYAETSGYREVDDPTVTEKGTKSFTENVKDKLRTRYNAVKSNLHQTYDTTVSNAKKTITVENAKRVGKTAITNAGRNMGEDISQLGRQGVSSVKNLGLTQKQSKRKYGKEQVPTLFGGEGSFAGDVFGNMRAVNKQKQSNKQKQKSVNKNVNTVNVIVKTKKKQSMDVLSGMATPKKITSHNFEISAFKSTGGIKVKPLTGKSTKSLNGMNTKLTNMKSLDNIGNLNMFGKKRKGGLF